MNRKQTNSNQLHPLARVVVKAIVPYASARRSMSGGAIWLNANENALAPEYQLNGSFNRYPSCQPKAVIDGYTAYAGLAPEQVLVSRGADEGIELLIRSFCEPKQHSISICPPTYGMYAISAESNQVPVNIVPLTAGFTLDLPALFSTTPKLVFICSPNNPTGNVIPREQIIAVLKHYQHSALVVVDEAYIEFAPQASVIGLLSQYPNLVILRTLSKAFALAGLRCGFTLAAPDIINALKQMIAPYPLAEPVAQIAAQALTPAAVAIMQDTVQTLNALRDDFIAYARECSAVRQVWPSDANYVLLQVQDAAACVEALQQQGILIRNQSGQLGLSQVVRVSIGSPAEMVALKSALDSYFTSATTEQRERA